MTPIDLRTVRFILIVVHSLFAILCLVLRPNLFELVPGYAGMLVVMSTQYWGLCAAALALGMLHSGSRPLVQLPIQLGSGMLLTLITISVSTATGPNLSTVSYLVFGGLSIWAFYRVLSIWLCTQAWFQRVQDRVHCRD